jgi:uncharacterized protein YndB with AHSA1/START domain
MGKITVKQYFRKSPAAVFAVLSKHSTYNTAFWPLQVERIKDSANPDNPDGTGSIRQMGFGPLKPLREEIITMEPDHLIEYQLIKNPLISYHLGRLQLEPQGSGTLLTYTIELVGKVPLSTFVVLANLKLAVTLGMAKIARQLNSKTF